MMKCVCQDDDCECIVRRATGHRQWHDPLHDESKRAGHRTVNSLVSSDEDESNEEKKELKELKSSKLPSSANIVVEEDDERQAE